MTRRSLVLTAAVVALAAGAGVLAGRALATGAPTQTPLTWAGVVTDAQGKPYATAQSVRVGFWDAASGGTLKCQSATVQADAGTGRFQVALPGDCVDAIHATADLWTEATVGAAQTVLPRVHVGAVPYALEADVAAKAGGALKTQVDGIAADVAGLKGATGGGGPWVVDAKGVKLGKLIDGTLDVGPITFATSTGYLVSISLDGSLYDDFGGQIIYAGANCTGAVFQWTSSTQPKPASVKRVRHTTEQGGMFFVPDAGSNTMELAQPVGSTGSYLYKGTCNNTGPGLSPGQTVWLMKQVSSADIGLPATITGPLTIQP